MSKLKAPITACLLALLLQGCRLIPEYEPLINLKNLGENRAQMDKYLKAEEGRYKKLELDLKDKRLKEGISRQELVSRYGEPVLSRPTAGQPARGEVLIYRHPTEYFSSDMIYLYLDDKDRLASYQIEPPPLLEEEKEPAG